MSVITLQLTARDPIVARDGRPFGAGQGNRMRGLGWPLPSVVAGSFRTALVKANQSLSFEGDMPQRLMNIKVAGVFPMVQEVLYLPAPNDCLWNEKSGKILRVQPTSLAHDEGVDFPTDGLRPVGFAEGQAEGAFKSKAIPAWWPLKKYAEWLTTNEVEYREEWFEKDFLSAAKMETRDHVCLDADTGTAAESQLFSTAGLNVTHLPRFGVPETKSFHDRFAEVTLSARVKITEKAFDHVEHLNTWHPLGGERRLVHWNAIPDGKRWECPETVKSPLEIATRVRMVLVTPAIFDHGWRPNWLDPNTLMGRPFDDGPTLKLVGVSNARWKAVSGWSLAPPRGPKAIRRMVPAGSVYYFENVDGNGYNLATNGWLRPVSDALQDRNDGFGLAIWGTW